LNFPPSIFAVTTKGISTGLPVAGTVPDGAFNGPVWVPLENRIEETAVAVFTDYHWVALVIGKSIMPDVVELAGHLSAGSADTTRSSQFGIITEACVPLFTVMFVPCPKHTSTTFFVSPLCSPPNGIDSLVSPRRALNLGLATSIRHL